MDRERARIGRATLAAVSLMGTFAACSDGGGGGGGGSGPGVPQEGSTVSSGTRTGATSGGGPSSGYETTCDPVRTLPQRTQTSLAIDPSDDRIVYVGVEQSGFFKTINGGNSWTRISNGIGGRTSPKGTCYSEFYSTRIDALNPARVIFGLVGGPGTIDDFNAKYEGPYLSTDGGLSWRQLVTQPGINTSSYAVAMHPTDSKVLYAGVNGNRNFMSKALSNSKGVIYKTTDGGATWVELDTGFVEGMRCNGLELDPRDPEVLYATIMVLPPNGGSNYAAQQPGVLKSTDGGKTWASKIQGFDTSAPSRVAMQKLAVSATAPDRLFGASFSVAYYSSDRGESWAKSGRGVSVFDFDGTVAAGTRLVGLDPHDASLYESTDGGATWRVVGTLPPGAVAGQNSVSRITDLELGHQDARLVYISEADGRVWRSLDGGGSWTRVLSGDQLPP